MHYQELELEGWELRSTYQMGELEAPPNGRVGSSTPVTKWEDRNEYLQN